VSRPGSSCVVFGLVLASRCLPQRGLRARYPAKDSQRICRTARQEPVAHGTTGLTVTYKSCETHQPRAVEELIEMAQSNGPLEKSLLACRDWPARSVTAGDLTSGGEGEAEFFEVPKQFLQKSFFGSRFDLDPVESDLNLSRNNSILVSNYLDILAWTSMRNRLLARSLTERDVTPAGEEEEEFFEVPLCCGVVGCSMLALQTPRRLFV
jgi:hypothetical protein